MKEKGSYIENIKDGYWKRFSNNGWNKDKGLRENGKREGLWEFFVKGQLNWKGNFVGGETTGLWKKNYYIRGRKLNFLKKPTFLKGFKPRQAALPELHLNAFMPNLCAA